MPQRKAKGTELSVFKGREARLNRAIFHVLSVAEPQAKWDIFKNVTRLRTLKRKRYAVVEVRIAALETQGYLVVSGERETKQGGKTPLFRMTSRAKLVLALDSRSIDEIIGELNEQAASTILKAISSAEGSGRSKS